MRSLLLVVLCFSGPLFAEEARVKVRGMVCGFCAQGLSKTFMQKSEVDGVRVDLDKKSVTVDFKNGKNMTDSEIQTLIGDAGFTVDQIERQ